MTWAVRLSWEEKHGWLTEGGEVAEFACEQPAAIAGQLALRSRPVLTRAAVVRYGATSPGELHAIDVLDLSCLRGFLPAAGGGLTLPGWTCPCGAFNGAGRFWLEQCRACGGPCP